jgi:hypothetical protein
MLPSEDVNNGSDSNLEETPREMTKHFYSKRASSDKQVQLCFVVFAHFVTVFVIAKRNSPPSLLP